MADPVRLIADAVLYEGYILWPYTRSAMKNRQRWTFGGVYPKGHSEGRDDDPWAMQTECLVETDDGASVEIGVRFLHVVERKVARQTAGGLEEVDELTVGGERHLAWDEAVEREVVASGLELEALGEGHRVPISIEATSEEEELREPSGARAGAIVRSWQPLEGAVEIRTERLEGSVHRLTVRILNTTPWTGGPREDALRSTFCSAHTVLRATGARFVSVTDPPDELREAAESCRNEGTWPVLVGEPGDRSTMLSSPIILEDYPRIAPESPGDLFDGGEIDQMLTLNILSLTDEEKAEMRDSDPRAREILERTESLTEEQLMALHGTIREFGMARHR
ncbi:MAG: hypothetical protein ACR2ML_10515 [Solirubrobacteraceae bacterium]